MDTAINNKLKAQIQAAELGASKVATVDLAGRCAMLQLPAPAADGSIRISVFGQQLQLTPPHFDAVVVSTGQPAKPADRILAIHYLLTSAPVAPTGEWISFRDFPGGQFYWEPFCSRTVKPLVQRIGNDLALLRKNLDRFAWSALSMPDLSARIQAVGAVEVALIYAQGDDEFEPSAELLFDACAHRVFCAEDASVIASRICLGLL
jgi:hypothetical protein